jgi:Inner membrane protein YgaP-like, transmembrane domain
MNIDRTVFGVAGSFILLSLVLSQVHSQNWLWFTAFVGANLLQASFSGFCPMAKILKAIGVKPGTAFH